MQNVLSATPKVPKDCDGVATALKTRVSSQTQGNLLIKTPHKVKKQITSFQHAMAQNIPFQKGGIRA